MLGTSVKMKHFPSASDVLRAFRAGIIDGASLTIDEVLRLLHEGYKIKIVFINDFSTGADSVIAREATSFKELKGKKIGAEITALGSFFVSRALEINNMKAHDVTIVPIEINSHEEAYKAGKVDAIVTFEPVRSKLLRLGGKEVFNSKQVPREIIDVTIIREDYLKKYPHVVEKLREGWFSVIEKLKKKDREILQYMATMQNISQQETESSLELVEIPNYQENSEYLKLSSQVAKNIGSLEKYLREKKIILTNSKKYSYETLF